MIVGSWRFPNLSICGKLILKNILRGKTILAYIFQFILPILFIVQSYVMFQSQSYLKNMFFASGLVILFQWFSFVSQPILSYFAYYSDGLICRVYDYPKDLLKSHYNLNLIYSLIITAILAITTQRLFVVTTTFLMSITLMYIIEATQNVLGGVFRIDITNLFSNKARQNIVGTFSIAISFVLVYLCVLFEDNIYWHISFITICSIIFFQRNHLFDILCNKFYKNRYVILAKYRGESLT